MSANDIHLVLKVKWELLYFAYRPPLTGMNKYMPIKDELWIFYCIYSRVVWKMFKQMTPLVKHTISVSFYFKSNIELYVKVTITRFTTFFLAILNYLFSVGRFFLGYERGGVQLIMLRV